MDTEDAREALSVAETARSSALSRAVTPPWYYPGVGGCLLFAFASVSIDWDLIPYGVLLGIGLGPLLLSMAAGHATGVTVDRYYATPAARRITSLLGPFLVALIAFGLTLEWGADLRGAMAGCGMAAMAAMVIAGRKLDRAADEARA